MRVFGPVVAAVALLLAGGAQANEITSPATTDAPEVLPPQLEDVVAARAAADAELARAGAADLFDNVTESGRPAVRHKASGLVCSAADDAIMPLHVYEGSPRGDDISCGSRTQGITTTTYATRYGDGTTAEDALAGSIAAIHQTFQDVKPYRGDGVSVSNDDLPARLTARFDARFKGQHVFTRTSAVAVGDWIIAQRVTAPMDMAVLADMVGELNFVSSLISMGAAGRGAGE